MSSVIDTGMNIELDELVKVINGIKKAHYDSSNYPESLREYVRWERLSSKWVKVIVCGTNIEGKVIDRSVYCFVSLMDYTTKVLGVVRRGDIHKPASWKIPAKHARGNVYSAESWKCLGPYGVQYLRG